jgi:hypothetical protein
VRRPQWPISVILSSITRCREAASTRVAAPSARDQRIIASPAAFVPGTIPCRANPARPTVRHSVGRRLGSENGSRPKIRHLASAAGTRRLPRSGHSRPEWAELCCTEETGVPVPDNVDLIQSTDRRVRRRLEPMSRNGFDLPRPPQRQRDERLSIRGCRLINTARPESDREFL